MLHMVERKSAFLSIVVGGRVETPVGLTYTDCGVDLQYEPSGARVRVSASEQACHLRIQIIDIEGTRPDAVLWGPYATAVGTTVGETVGVVRDSQLAIGLLGLNYWTLAGIPSCYAEPPPKPAGASTRYGYDQCAAWPVPGGSLLQAHALAREPGVPDGGVIGSGVALFACRVGDALETIGRIEVAEGLPHPLLDGVWAKVANAATQSYLITDFAESTLDDVLTAAEESGLHYVYHGDAFATWGHFELKRGSFPDGDESMRRCVARAAQRGIYLGVHTLSNFLTTNDAYVTPVPHPHLQRALGGGAQFGKVPCGGGRAVTAEGPGVPRLLEDVGRAEVTLPVAESHPFQDRGWLAAVAVGDEIVRYTEVGGRNPVALLGCERGAFGTVPAEHAAGTPVEKLADHAYRVFFPDLTLQDAVADRIIDLFNRTGMRQISFDGLEGCSATGHPTFAENRFVTRCFAGWHQEVINDASLLTHFDWHVHTRMNWGEPWGAAMREGMAAYRFDNQEYFERNLLPHMLGWFLVRLSSADFEATTLDDIEWVLARCAGYGAGCGIVANLATLRGHGLADDLLGAVHTWEAARRAGAFREDQRARLRAPDREWHLDTDRDVAGRYSLREVHLSPLYACHPAEMQPGQPGGADWWVKNVDPPQPLLFRLRVLSHPGQSDGAVVDPSLVVGDHRVVFRGELRPGEYLVCDGSTEARVVDANWRLLRSIPVPLAPVVRSGEQAVAFSCTFTGECRPSVSVRFMTLGPAEIVGEGPVTP